MFHFNFDQTQTNTSFDLTTLWDLIIIGGGPAGMNAALYAKRKGLTVGIVTKDIGGQLQNTSEVDNYLGFKWLEGKTLIEHFKSHIASLDIPILDRVDVVSIDKKNHLFNVNLSTGKIIHSKTILIATGGLPKRLDVKGEKEFANKGVSYCTTCDAPFFKDKHVIVAGGGNSAAEAVLDLVPWAKKITVVHRSKFRADEIILDKLKHIEKLEIHLETQILEIQGNEKMTGVLVFDKKSGETRSIEADGIFIEIGTTPNNQLVKDLVLTNEIGEIIVDDQQKTSLDGLYAAGDVTQKAYKQIIISASDGAIAALNINQYLQKNNKEKIFYESIIK